MGRRSLLTERAELERLDAHFVSVLRALHTRPPPRLSRVQRLARAMHLDRLDAYRRRRVFPKNRDFPGRLVPHFVDAAGTRCAMGHLIEASGGRDLVQHVARERNYARIRELRNLPELGAWLDANGISLDEAAQIQPTYCGTLAENCLCRVVRERGLLQGTPANAGTNLAVAVVYGPGMQVKVGDVVPLRDLSGVVGTNDIIFATWNGDGSWLAEFGASSQGADGGETQVIVPSSMCRYGPALSLPGPMPLGVVSEALTSLGSCEQVLADHDARWADPVGDCGAGAGGFAGASDAGVRLGNGEVSEESSCGCRTVRQVPSSAEAIVAISAVVLLYGARRSWRRR
jgi:hypothetical protein